MKIKTSRDPSADPGRLSAVRKEAGDGVELFTDANGALTPQGRAVLGAPVRQRVGSVLVRGAGELA